MQAVVDAIAATVMCGLMLFSKVHTMKRRVVG